MADEEIDVDIPSPQLKSNDKASDDRNRNGKVESSSPIVECTHPDALPPEESAKAQDTTQVVVPSSGSNKQKVRNVGATRGRRRHKRPPSRQRPSSPTSPTASPIQFPSSSTGVGEITPPKHIHHHHDGASPSATTLPKPIPTLPSPHFSGTPPAFITGSPSTNENRTPPEASNPALPSPQPVSGFRALLDCMWGPRSAAFIRLVVIRIPCVMLGGFWISPEEGIVINLLHSLIFLLLVFVPLSLSVRFGVVFLLLRLLENPNDFSDSVLHYNWHCFSDY